MGNITGDFIGNYANISAENTGSSSASAGYSGGGAIYNYSGSMGNITGDFIGNYANISASASGSQPAYSYYSGGGAIYNRSTMGNITGDFIGNYANISANGSSVDLKNTGGGAIWNSGTISGITGSFINNYVIGSNDTHGGAIFTTRNLSINANDSTSEFTGNYVSRDGGETKDYEAIYVADSNATLTLNAVNNGNIILNDYINGVDGYAVAMTGDTTGTIQLFNDIKNADVTASNVNIDMINGAAKEYNFKSLTTENTNFAIDVDILNRTSDSISTSEASNGNVILNSINFLNAGDDNINIKNFMSDVNSKIQIL